MKLCTLPVCLPARLPVVAAQLALSVAQLEAQVTRLAELLANVLSDTRGRVEKKQAQVSSCTRAFMHACVRAHARAFVCMLQARNCMHTVCLVDA